ncbi:MAG: hypothetical protein EXR00_00285 [Alphaproteobacteria bacterium]|nr:hypothetical protein [Alphaproteobacteria bacterium]
MKKIILPALLLLSACATAPTQVASADGARRSLCSDGYDVAKSVDPLGEYTVAPRVDCRLEIEKPVK